jgi:hypothetical protein
MTLEAKRHGWLLRGWFHGISCIGGIAGVMTYSARIVMLTKFYTTRKMDLISEPTPLLCYNSVACDVDVQHAFLQARGSFTDEVSEVCRPLCAPTSFFVCLPDAASVSRLLVPRCDSRLSADDRCSCCRSSRTPAC